MIYTLLSFAITALFITGMILAARVRPRDDKDGCGQADRRRLEFIRKSSLCR